MLRALIFAYLSVILAAPTFAAPPTEDNWWQYMDRYIGEFQLQSAEFREPILSFQAKWGTPRVRMSYQSESIGNAPESQMAGFCGWNAQTGRLEWQEVLLGEADGRIAATGFCINATPNTMTWVVTNFDENGFVRQFTMVDTFNEGKNHLERSMVILRGEPVKRAISSWIKVE